MLTPSVTEPAYFSENEIVDEAKELGSEESITVERTPLYNLPKWCFFVVFCPVWIPLSFIIEVIVVPFNITVEFLKSCNCSKLYVFLGILVAPFIFLGLAMISVFFTPVSIITKAYGFLLEDDFIFALKELLYPQLHPIFDDWLMQTPRPEKKEVIAKREQDKSYKGVTINPASYQSPTQKPMYFESDI